MCLNADVVPFVSFGSHDSLYITWEGIWDCHDGNCTCVPFCWSRIPLPPTPFALHGSVLGTLKMLNCNYSPFCQSNFQSLSTLFALPQRVLGIVVVHPILSHPVSITAQGPEHQGPFFSLLMHSCICPSSSAVYKDLTNFPFIQWWMPFTQDLCTRIK